MAEEKEKRKNYHTEWSFSFDELGDRINEFVHSIGVNDPEAVKTEHFSEPVGGATSARVRLDIPVAETVVNSLVSADNLIEAEVTHIGEMKFAVTGDEHKIVNMSQQTEAADWMRNMFGWIGTQGRLRWNVGLTPRFPLDLDVHSGVGKTTLDLGKLQLAALNVDGGAGQLQLTLPENPASYTAHVSGGVGEVDVRVPAGATVDLQVTSGTKISLEIGDGAVVTARIKGGLGQTDVLVPANMAVRVQADLGMGDISVPAGYIRTSGDDSSNFVSRSGVWQTPGYENAEKKIAIRFEGGMGGLRVR